MENLSEAQIQALIVLVELAAPKETPNNNHYHFYPKTIEDAETYFRSFLTDWRKACPSLEKMGLVILLNDSYTLTKEGLQTAYVIREKRPPIYYWYEEFYARAPRSPAYREFCQLLYGQDLTQAGFSDMAQINLLPAALELRKGVKAVDLGCGLGRVAEYLSDLTGAEFLGVDYSNEAVRQAQERTVSKRERLDYAVSNIDTLDFPTHSFDAILSIDSLYMPGDLEATLRKMIKWLRPGGYLAIYWIQMVWDSDGDRSTLLPGNTPLGIAMHCLQLPYETYDVSRETYELMQRKYQLAQELRPKFEAEDNSDLYNFLAAESEPSPEPYNPNTCNQARYLYISKPKPQRDMHTHSSG